MKNGNVEKIENEEISLQCRVFTEFPFPAKLRRAVVFFEGQKKHIIDGYMAYWEKKVGTRAIKITANPHYGFPTGNDILVILYLIKKAREQNSGGSIEFKSLNEFLRTFDYGCDQPNRTNAFKAFQRIFYSTWYYEDGSKKLPFRVMAYCELFPEDGLFKGEEFKNKIVLTKEFWDIILDYPVPYNFETVVKLKKSPTALNLYLFLVYRTWVNWKIEKKEVFLPYFGENGLKFQLSSEISEDRFFRRDFKNWVEQIKEIWPECPVYFKHDKGFDDQLSSKKKQKIFKDGLFIHTQNPDQLHVPPHWDKELRLAREEGKKKALSEAQKPTPGQIDFIMKYGDNSTKLKLDAGEISKTEALKYISEVTSGWNREKKL